MLVASRFFFVGLLLVCGGVAMTARAEGPTRPIDFNRQIKPILSNTCFRCHGPDADERKGGSDGLRLDTVEGATQDLGGYAAIVPGKPDKSAVIERINSTDPDAVMPPPSLGKKLTPQEIALITEWIRQGARYSQHWSYVKPVRPELPAVKNRGWPRNPIDHFILARLEREGLMPSPEADRYALIRRVSLDLTGLPPTVAEVDTYVRDTDPAAYENLVDNLLAKPTYGEHWAHMWLDLSRYADSAGYADDKARTIWLFRDYVIRSLNTNKPFDQFTIEQIAGDLLANPTEEQLIATAFHRNTLTNNEGGTNDEEFRNVAVVDRVNTTMAVWMGTTIACAQCHNHKYDPISQEEFFRFFAFFNNTEDADRPDESPLLSIYTPEQERNRAAWQAELAKLEPALKTPLVKFAFDKAGDAKPARLDLTWRVLRPTDGKSRVNLAAKVGELKRQLANTKPLTVPIMRDLARGKGRKTQIQHRGNFLDLGKEVVAGTPAVFPPLPAGPVNRMTLARWLVDNNNPLTARVIANRYWEQIFGVGIVSSSEEFGSQGDLPFHPELLDWLATELVRGQWDMKQFVKLLVTSAAYRQSSRVTPELQHRDPENRLLARGPRFRLSAEMVRDQALAVGGLLSAKMFGPPVKPPQPSSGLNAAFGAGIDWQTSDGEDKYRRALYTTWRRSNPYPSMTTFDAPNREVCTVRRGRTNTPLQALVTLNDPVYIEAAQALSRRIIAEGGSNPTDRANYAFRACLSRPPHDEELARLVALYERTLAQYTEQPDEAKKMALEPLGPAPKEMNVAELAAWTVVSNVLLNLDEMLMKR
jgi:hypothetical protein